MKDTLPLHVLPIQWATNQQYQGVISKPEKLPNLRQVALTHKEDPAGDFYKLFDRTYMVLPTRWQFYDIQNKIPQEKFVTAIQPSMDIIRNQQKNVEIVTTVAWQHID